MTCCLSLTTVGVTDASSLSASLVGVLALFFLGLLVLSALTHRRLLRQARQVAAHRAFLAALLEHLPDAALVVDRDGQVLQANRAARPFLTGLDPGSRHLAALAQRWQARDHHGQPLTLAPDVLQRPPFEGTVLTVRFTTPEGAERVVQVSGARLPDGCHGVLLIRDLTAHLQAERDRALLQEAALTLVQTLDADTVLARLLSLAGETLQARALQVFLADEDARLLRRVAAQGVPAEVLAATATLPYDAPYLTARAARTRAVQVAAQDQIPPDVAASQAVLARLGGQTAVALPLLVGDRLVGVLAFTTDRPLSAISDDLAALATFGHLCASALANAQAYAAEQQLRQSLERLVQGLLTLRAGTDPARLLQQAADLARALLGADLATGRLSETFEVTHPAADSLSSAGQATSSPPPPPRGWG